MTIRETGLTDELLASVIRARGSDPDETILDDILVAVAATPQERPWLPSWQPSLRLAMLAAALILAAAGAIAIGSGWLKLDPILGQYRNGEIVAVRRGSLVAIGPGDVGERTLDFCSGNCSLPSSSRDGSLLAFARSDSVIVRELDTGFERTVGSCGSDCLIVALSPDGSRVVYANGSGARVATIGGQTEYLPIPADVEDVRWRPDGMELLFTEAGTLARLRLDGSDPEILLGGRGEALPEYGGPVYAAWSPDGDRIALVVDPPDPGANGAPFDFQLWTMDATGGDRRMIWNRPGCCMTAWGGPTWSPDGTRIAVVATADASFFLWTINADGSDVRRSAEVNPDRVAWLPKP